MKAFGVGVLVLLMMMPAMASVPYDTGEQGQPATPSVPCGTGCQGEQDQIDITNVNTNTNINVVDVRAVGMEIVQILNNNYYVLPDGQTIPVEDYKASTASSDGRAGSGAVWFNEQGRAKQLPIYDCSFSQKLQPPCTPPFQMA